ncbi:MAG: bifunctional nuclease family protein [Gemmatimonadetes bacterium]|nr:MAG: bifunctional nuclease family protein [Gemmatimonadota bacterium]
MSVRMKIQGLLIDPVSQMPIVILKNSSEDRVLPIWVGVFEANAIAMQLEKILSPRPMTHDLLCSTIEQLGGSIEKIVITDLRDATFYAILHLDLKGKKFEVDARPSDAMALALRCDAPIFVEESVLEKSSKPGDTDSMEPDRLRRWLETVDPEELGQYEM